MTTENKELEAFSLKTTFGVFSSVEMHVGLLDKFFWTNILRFFYKKVKKKKVVDNKLFAIHLNFLTFKCDQKSPLKTSQKMPKLCPRWYLM